MDDPKSLAEAVGREFREVREGTIPRLRPMVGDTAADIPDEERWGATTECLTVLMNVTGRLAVVIDNLAQRLADLEEAPESGGSPQG